MSSQIAHNHHLISSYQFLSYKGLGISKLFTCSISKFFHFLRPAFYRMQKKALSKSHWLTRIIYLHRLQAMLSSRARFQKQSKSDLLRSNPTSLIGRSHFINADHDRLIRWKKYETKQFILSIELWYKSLIGEFQNHTVSPGLHKNVQMMLSIHYVTMEGFAISFMCVIMASAVHAYSIVHHKTRIGRTKFDRYVYAASTLLNIW